MAIIDDFLYVYIKKTLNDFKDRRKIYLFLYKKELLLWFFLIILLWLIYFLKQKGIISLQLMFILQILLVIIRFYITNLARKRMKKYRLE